MKHLSFLFILITLFSCEKKPVTVLTEKQDSHSESLLQAISIIDEDNVWVSGHRGTYANTTDGGASWNAYQMPDADTLQFRDLHAFNNQEVLLMSAGPGVLSQIRKTTDGGKNWKIAYLMEDSLGFLNTIEFWDNQNGLAFGDAINEGLFVLKTVDGGENWERINPEKLPKAQGAEGGFAASGTCIAVKGNGNAWIATGAGKRPRVIYTDNYGDSWKDFSTPIVAGAAAGITSINFWNEKEGFVAGGDLSVTDQYTRNVAFTINGGNTWSLAEHPIFKGSIYGAGLSALRDEQFIFVGGPKGLDFSNDLGTTWTALDSANYWAVKFSEEGIGWATGTEGKILKITLQ